MVKFVEKAKGFVRRIFRRKKDEEELLPRRRIRRIPTRVKVSPVVKDVEVKTKTAKVTGLSSIPPISRKVVLTKKPTLKSPTAKVVQITQPVIVKPTKSTVRFERKVAAVKRYEKKVGERAARMPEVFRAVPGLRGRPGEEAREQRVWTRPGLQKLGRETLALPGRVALELPERLVVAGRKAELAYEGLRLLQTRRQTRRELARAARLTPRTVARSYDPRTPEGLLGVATLGTLTYGLGRLTPRARPVTVLPKSRALVPMTKTRLPARLSPTKALPKPVSPAVMLEAKAQRVIPRYFPSGRPVSPALRTRWMTEFKKVSLEQQKAPVVGITGTAPFMKGLFRQEDIKTQRKIEDLI